MLLAILVAVLGAQAAPDRAAGVDLQFRLEPGVVLSFEQKLATRAEGTGPIAYVDELSLEQSVDLEVREVLPDGSRRCELRFGRVRGTITDPMEERVEFDSASDANEGEQSSMTGPVVAMLELMAGRTFGARVDSHGRVLEVSGFVDAYRGTTVEFLFAMSGYPLSEQLFIDEVQVFFALLPTEPVAVDSRWTVRQGAELSGQELSFDLECLASRVDAEESVWSYASVGVPTAPTRRLEAAAAPAPGLSELSLDAEAQRWLQQKITVEDGSMSGVCRVSTADGAPIEIRHAVRQRGTIPHPLAGTRVSLDSAIDFCVRRAGARAATSAGAAPEVHPAAAAEWLGQVERLVDGARVLEVGHSLTGVISGDGVALDSSSDPAAGLRCVSFRPEVHAAGRFEAVLRAPALPAWLVVLDSRGDLLRTGTDADGSARIEFDVRGADDRVLVLVETAASARGPFVLTLDRAGASPVLKSSSSVTPFDGTTLLDATALLEGSPERREELLAHYGLFAAATDRLGGPPSHQAHMHAQHAMACRANGEIARARTALDTAWKRLESATPPDPAVRFELLGIESGLSADEGRLGKARAALDELLACSADPQMHPEIAALSLHDHAVFLLTQLDDREQAAAYSREGLALYSARSLGAGRIEAALCQTLAEGLWIRDPRGAEAALDRAIAILTVAGDTSPALYAILHSRLASLLLDRGEAERARRAIELALDTAVCAGGWDQVTVAQVLSERARILDACDEASGAFQARQDSLAIRLAWNGDSHPSVRSARIELARDLQRLGNAEDAWSEVRRILATDREVARSRLAALSERERLQYQATQRAALDLAHDLPARDEEHVRLAYDAALLAKGAVARSLDEERARLRSADPADTAGILGELRATQATLSSASLATRAGPKRLEELRARRDELERKLTSAAGAADDTVLPPDAASVRAELDPGSVLVDFVIHGHGRGADSARLSAWVTSAGSEELVRVELGEAVPIERAVEAWRAALTSGPSRGLAVAEEARAPVATSAQEIRKLLWEPIETAIDGALRVIVCPDGFLAGVPFGALPNDAGGFLIEDFPFAYVSDASALAVRAPGSRTADYLLVVGGLEYGPESESRRWPPLPGTGREIAAVAALHRDVLGARSRVHVLDGTRGTESRLREEIEGARVVHIATHGFAETTLNGRDAGASEVHAGLVCAPPSHAGRATESEDDAEDGLLTAEEIAWLDLSRAELVVLSACSSGLGRAVPGEGMLGLRRAFRRAGAASVVSALWPVPDEATAELMTGFYERMWRGGLAPAEALRGAQLSALNAARERGEGDSPLAWGAFVLE